jgi:hypothetical protein
MTIKDPSFFYVGLVLPTLFGLTLVGEGLSKVLKDKRMGWVSVILGLLFIAVIIFVFFFLFEGNFS